MTEPKSTAFAIAGLGGNNAHGAGFLAAAQAVTARAGGQGLYPGLEMISCTSGAIAEVAAYLEGRDLEAEVQEGIDKVNRATSWWPRGPWFDEARLPLITLGTGLPGIFKPYRDALAERLIAWSADVVRGRRPPWFTTFEDLLDTVLPARMLIPERPYSDFERWARLFNRAEIGIAFNSFDPTGGEEYLYVNEAGMDRIRRHHDESAVYHGMRQSSRYRRIDADAIKRSLWLFWYGFERPGQHVDGCYARSIILNELTFVEKIYAVKPINDRWLGPLPSNALEVLDMQTELWMGTSYRLQWHQIDLVNRLLRDERLRSAEEAATTRAERLQSGEWTGATPPDKRFKEYHYVDLIPVEIQMQRGFFTYFIEDLEVFKAAYEASLPEL